MTDHKRLYNDRIDRRTVLTLAGSGMAALAGCGGSSSSSGNTASTSTQAADGTDGLKSLTYYSDDSGTPDLYLRTEITEDADINKINLISDGSLWDSVRFATGETKGSLSLLFPETNGISTISQSNSKLVLIGENTETEVPITYQPEIQLVRVGDQRKDPEVGEGDIPRSKDLGVFLENITDQPALINKISVDHPKDSVQYEDRTPATRIVEKNSQDMFRVYSLFSTDRFDCKPSETAEATVRFVCEFQDDLVIKVPLVFEPNEYTCDVALNGSAYTVPTSSETATATDSSN